MGTWRRHVAALGGVVLVVLIALLGVQQATEQVQTEQPEASATVGELVDGAAAGQTFRAEHAGLDGVAVRVGTYGRENRGALAFELRGPGLTEAITQTMDLADLEDNAYQAFEFARIRGSAGRRFTFTLEIPGAERGQGITVWGATEDVYPDGQAILTGLDGEKEVADLTFRPTYDPPLLVRADLFLERLAGGKPSVWGDRGLYVMLGGGYVALLYVFLVVAVGGGGEEE